jgi:cytidine deaminase
MTSADKQAALNAAKRALANAYAPYSKQPKAAAVIASDGSIYAAGCVENAAWPAAICAEAVAVGAAVSDGKQSLQAIVLVPKRLPCGACLQVLREFGLHIDILIENESGELQRFSLPDLLPNSFGPDNVEH